MMPSGEGAGLAIPAIDSEPAAALGWERCRFPARFRGEGTSVSQGGPPMRTFVLATTALALVAALAMPANARLLARKDLSLATALTIATTAAETCKGQGYRAAGHGVG